MDTRPETPAESSAAAAIWRLSTARESCVYGAPW